MMTVSQIDERLRALLALSTRLSDLIEEENRLLGKERPSALKPLLDEKERLSQQFAHEINILRADKSTLAQADSATRATLKSELDRFQQAVMRNGRILRRLKMVSEGMISTIVEHVNPAAKRTTYSNPASGVSLRQAPQTIALNAVV
jgi:ABC-type transporter Mla MlaB component